MIYTVMLTAVKLTSFIEENNIKLIPSFSIASKYLRNALAPSRTPLGELKRSPDPLAEFQDKGRGNRKGMDGKDRKQWAGEGKGREAMEGGEGRTVKGMRGVSGKGKVMKGVGRGEGKGEGRGRKKGRRRHPPQP